MVATLRALTPIFSRIARSEEIISAVSASIQNESNQSIPRRSQELGIAQTTLWRIMRKDLGLHGFKIKLTQELKSLGHLKRRNFYNWSLAKLEENEEFYRIIIFSDEAHFWLNDFVNKQNMRYWSATNPNVLRETPLHPQKVTVWCGFHAGGVLGPYSSMESAIALCWKIICGQNWMNFTSTICGFNKTVPLATQHASQSIY